LQEPCQLAKDARASPSAAGGLPRVATSRKELFQPVYTEHVRIETLLHPGLLSWHLTQRHDGTEMLGRTPCGVHDASPRDAIEIIMHRCGNAVLSFVAVDFAKLIHVQPDTGGILQKEFLIISKMLCRSVISNFQCDASMLWELYSRACSASK
jgi:hypothetical protein